jgi:hypothetical protein
VLVLLYVLLVFLAAWWLIASFVLTRAGWIALSKRFFCDRNSFAGKWNGPLSGKIGKTRYFSSVWLGFSADGLYIKITPVPAIFHTPIKVPWSAIERIETTTGSTEMFEIIIHDVDTRMILTLKNSGLHQCSYFLGDKLSGSIDANGRSD